MPESLKLTKWTVKRNQLCGFRKEIFEGLAAHRLS